MGYITLEDAKYSTVSCAHEKKLLSYNDFMSEMFNEAIKYGVPSQQVDGCADMYYYGEVSGCYNVQ